MLRIIVQSAISAARLRKSVELDGSHVSRSHCAVGHLCNHQLGLLCRSSIALFVRFTKTIRVLDLNTEPHGWSLSHATRNLTLSTA